MKLKMLAFVLCVALTASMLVGCGGGGGPLDVCKKYYAAMQSGDSATAFSLLVPAMQKPQIEGMAQYATILCMDMSDGSMDEEKVKSLNAAVSAFGVELGDGENADDEFATACTKAEDLAGLYGALTTWTESQEEGEEGEGEAATEEEEGVVTWNVVAETDTAATVEATEKKGDKETKVTIALTKIDGAWRISGVTMGAAGNGNGDEDNGDEDNGDEDSGDE